jgi:hypothetical protein
MDRAGELAVAVVLELRDKRLRQPREGVGADLRLSGLVSVRVVGELRNVPQRVLNGDVAEGVGRRGQVSGGRVVLVVDCVDLGGVEDVGGLAVAVVLRGRRMVIAVGDGESIALRYRRRNR